MIFSEQDMHIINKNLKTGKCPNCGSEEKKIIFSESIDLKYSEGIYLAIMARCPHCGYMYLFSKDFIMDKK